MAFDIQRVDIPKNSDSSRGLGASELATPHNILFARHDKLESLQQENLAKRPNQQVSIIFNFETSGVVHLDHLELELHPQHAIVIPPYQFHHFTNPHQAHMNWLVCTFDLATPSFIEPLHNRAIPLSNITLESLSRALDIFLNKHEAPCAIDELQALILTTVIRLKQETSIKARPCTLSTNDVVGSVNRILADTPNTKLSIHQIADAFSLSPSRMRAIFREAAGVSLGQYMLNFKIHTALALLADKSMSISDIAHQSGFSSIQAFSRTFKDRMGKSPSKFRR
ncbi:helix-turn-helix transcriptional regulator [Rubritalea marina]|uniref:helix-turn-helix transcriptional regulator n=1 Tax=Rubritalea marina TaxID=361055 RepID=UPI0003641353|nr:helix-turn-helix transcriptional regulator [Rubritalea marina]